MTTERHEPAERESTPAPGRGTTQVGPLMEGLERLTRRLPSNRPRPTRAPRPRVSARLVPPREQVAALLAALGDADHPLHAQAVDDLAALGPAVVPALCDALNSNQPWLTMYRAAEAAGRIGDGRAAGPLIQALHHPNSNVRWSAVRALTQIGDVRSLIELRRVAQGDQGRTSWGEPVAGAAQSALSEIGRRSVWGQSLELIKTAVSCVLMLLALILAFSVVSTARRELDTFGRLIPGQTQLPQLTLPTVQPTVASDESAPALESTVVAQPTTDAVLAPTGASAATGEQTGTVLQSANVRPLPNTNNEPIGRVVENDQIIFLARTTNSQWYLIRLGERRSENSSIGGADGTGWVNQALVSAPPGELPIQDPAAPAATSAPSP